MVKQKKKAKPGKIELIDEGPTIVIHIETQMVQVEDDGSSTVLSRQHGTKKIKIKAFSVSSNCNKFASAIVSKSKYISQSKHDHVAGLLRDWQKRHDTDSARSPREQKTDENGRRRSSGSSTDRSSSRSEHARSGHKERQQPNNEVTTHEEDEMMKQVQEQKETEEYERKRRMAIQQAREAAERREREERERKQREEEQRKAEAEERRRDEELRRKLREQQEQDEKSRKLKEKKDKKRRKKMEKLQQKFEKEMQKHVPKETADIEHVDTYLSYLYEDDIKAKLKSTYLLLQLVQMPEHLKYFVNNPTLTGALSRILQEERRKNVELITNILEIFFCFSNFTDLHHILIDCKIGATSMQVISQEMKRYEISISDKQPDRKRGRDNTSDSINLDGDPSQPTSARTDLESDTSGMSTKSTTGSGDRSMVDFKQVSFLHRQEKLLYVAFFILLNLAENLEIETKMIKLGIVKYLIKCLDRDNLFRQWLDELLILVLTFLRKISVFGENKDVMIESGIIAKLGNLTSIENPDVSVANLRLLFNLSFDRRAKSQMCAQGMLGWIVNTCLVDENLQQFAVKILYNVSTEHRHRAEIVFTDAVVMITNTIVNFTERLLPLDLIALAINLATHDRAEEQMCSHESLHKLIRRAHRTFDPLLMKFLCNLSSTRNADIILRFKKHLYEFVSMATHTDSQEFLVEVLGIVGNICLNDGEISYGEVIAQNDFTEFLTKLLVPGFAEDDVVLQVVVVLGTLASDHNSGKYLANQRLVNLLVKTLLDKYSDEEMALQATYTILKFLLVEETRELLIDHSELLDLIQELSQDRNREIKKFSQMCLDVLGECGDELMEGVRSKRFDSHNIEWVQTISSVSGSEMSALTPIEVASLMDSHVTFINEEDDEKSNDGIVEPQVMWQNVHFMSDMQDLTDDEIDFVEYD